MKTDPLQLNRLNLAIFYLMTLVIMFILKKYYNSASADQLQWILKPVAWLVSAFETLPYKWISDVGYVRADRAITIAPACAGVNFLIMAIGLPVVAFLHHKKTNTGRFKLWAAAILGAYALAVLVNVIRIIATVALYDKGISWWWFTPDRLHRMAGIAVYFSALGLYYNLWNRIIAAPKADKRYNRSWLPWAWYITGAVAVPIVHQLYRSQPWPPMEHCLTVIGFSALIFGLTRIVRERLLRTSGKKFYPKRHTDLHQIRTI